jgi:hypothetical protein
LTDTVLHAVLREFPNVESDPEVSFVLDEKLRLVYCNPAWDRFALWNGGASLEAARMIGTPVLECTSGAVFDYYQSLYADILAGAQARSHDFHCSSPEMERLMRMQVHGFRSVRALLVTCSLRVERPHSFPALPPIEAAYRDERGLIVMCCNCRRTRRLGTRPEVWDWIPDFVRRLPDAVSHGICKLCLAYYYPED